MKRRIRILAFIFIIVLLAVGTYMMFRQQEETTQGYIEEKAALYPTVTIEQKEEGINPMQGYLQAREIQSMYPALSVLSEDGSIGVRVGEHTLNLATVYGTVYTMDGQELGQVKTSDFLCRSGYDKATLQLDGYCEPGKEYLLEIQLETEAYDTVYYYTRVAYAEEELVAEGVAFVQEFIEKSMDKEEASDLGIYLETLYTSTTTLQNTTIHSDVKRISWEDWETSLCGMPHVQLLNVQGDKLSYLAEYQMAVKESEETNLYYRIKEYFTVRKSDIRMHLVEYERSAEQMFSASGHSFSANEIKLGLLAEEVPYLCDKKGKWLTFEQGGELWQYQKKNNDIVRVFTLGNVQNRELYANARELYDITLLEQDENGVITFFVAGYFARGSHEGQVGSALYRYTPGSEGYEELMFFESTLPEKLHRQQAEKLTYLANKTFYFYNQGGVYEYDLETRKMNTIIEQLEEGAFVASEGMDCIAWATDAGKATTITCMNLAEGTKREIKAEDGSYIRAIGYIGTDFVYGSANQQTIADSGRFLMSKVNIVSEQGELIKSYEEAAFPVVSGYSDDEMLYLERMTKNTAGHYVAAESYQIVNSQVVGEEASEAVVCQWETSKTDGTSYKFVLSELRTTKGPEVKLLTHKLSDDCTVLTDKLLRKDEREEALCYVYCRGELIQVTEDLHKAVKMAAECGGVAKDGAGELYRRAILSYSNELDEAETLIAVTDVSSAEAVANAWQSQPGEGRVFVLKGLLAEEILSYTMRDVPVVVSYQAGAYAVITGFTEETIHLRDLVTGEAFKIERQVADEQFAQTGHIFICKY